MGLLPKYFPSENLEKIKELTDINDHNEAVLILAQVLNSRRGLTVMSGIFAIYQAYGHMPEGLITIRNDLLKKMLTIADNTFANSDQLRGAF
jgi:hypothetical protein|tara:strand:+ start:22 stop:297 length:276 start_codon:yes stop_codon:yes gene_type:complete